MPAPSPTTKPSRSPSHGRLAPCRVVVAGRERPHGGEPGDAERRDAGLGAAADHRVGVAVLNRCGMRRRWHGRRRARGRHRGVRPLRAQPDRHLAGREIHDGREDEEWRDAVGPRSSSTRCSRSITSNPPMPLPMITPDPRGVVRRRSRAAAAPSPSRVAAIANWMKRAALLDVLLVQPVRAGRSPSLRRRCGSSAARCRRV